MDSKNPNTWWGPPKKFSTEYEERKISWLELFYDLVYVIAISKITHLLASHLTPSGLLDYIYFFSMIFWGWVNGSLHHDLHGSSGLRTMLMTLWQMMIVAALIVTISSNPGHLLFNATIAVMALQLYITYLWWSVGIYDKEHRKLNKPYTFFYLASLALMFLTLFLEQPYIRIVFYITLILNFIPPFIVYRVLRRRSVDFSLSGSMTERLGLFTIIIFGEVVLGVINGIGELNQLDFNIILHFALSILIVFSLWWIFFTLISDKPCKKGFQNSSLMQIFYIPTLMALGGIGVAFGGLFKSALHEGEEPAHLMKIIFSLAIGIFLLGINILLHYLEYPPHYKAFKKRIRQIIFITILLLFSAVAATNLSLLAFLSTIWMLLIFLIIAINYRWYTIEGNPGSKQQQS
ncbi:low temperature requirement protein A [Flavobacterium humi]|uniref:low temperature requirement protein A n=1 Tax=Flavobacterium humi TaxID=2562683 RepID=UPI00146C3054|nr:low temperature requirement protein A [Flavobacterium humi]